MKPTKKVFIFALDGVPLNLALKLSRNGVMPNLKKLFKKSLWGNLESTLPPLTGPAWVSFATGKNPDETGIFNFLYPKDDLNRLSIISCKDIRAKTFYELLEEKGKKCIFVNLPCSYPPRIKKGILISSFLAGDDFYYPRSLIKELPELVDYKLAPDFSLDLNIEKGLSDIWAIEKTRFMCAKRLFKKDWDLFFYLVSGTDWVMHLAFDKLIKFNNSKDNSDKKLLTVFKQVDDYLGWFLKEIPKNTKVILMSDHGFTTASKTFYINSWLKKNKLLVFDASKLNKGSNSLTELLIPKIKSNKLKIKILKKLALFFLRNPFYYNMLARIIRLIALLIPNLVPEYLLNVGLKINPAKTKAFALPGSGGWYGLYINDKKRFTNGNIGQKEYKVLRRYLYKRLQLELGKDNVWLQDKIYQGKHKKNFPDILYQANNIFISPAFSNKIYKTKKTNQHSKKGMFILSDEYIIKGKRLADKKITDLKPMILTWLK